jgi:signal transduction histidine kinase
VSRTTFNNLLTAILGYLEMIESQIDENALLKLLRNATQSVRRGEQLTHKLLAFARKQKLSPPLIRLSQSCASDFGTPCVGLEVSTARTEAFLLVMAICTRVWAMLMTNPRSTVIESQ